MDHHHAAAAQEVGAAVAALLAPPAGCRPAVEGLDQGQMVAGPSCPLRQGLLAANCSLPCPCLHWQNPRVPAPQPAALSGECAGRGGGGGGGGGREGLGMLRYVSHPLSKACCPSRTLMQEEYICEAVTASKDACSISQRCQGLACVFPLTCAYSRPCCQAGTAAADRPAVTGAQCGCSKCRGSSSSSSSSGRRYST